MAELGNKQIDLRDQTMDIEDIDRDYVASHVCDLVTQNLQDHEDYFKDREQWIQATRDFQYQGRQGYFENAADLHVPLIFIYGKATHARLWQVVGQQMNFFAVEANHEAFAAKEDIVRRFMNWNLSKWVNRGLGARDVFDRWLEDVCYEGSGILKLRWDRWSETFVDVEDRAEINELLRFNPQTFATETTQDVKFSQVDKEKTVVREAPHLSRVLIEDFFMPPGFDSPQRAPWCAQRVYFNDEELKVAARENKFDSDVIEEVITMRQNRFNSVRGSSQKEARIGVGELEGVAVQSSLEDRAEYYNEAHPVIEWYGRVYVKKKIDDEVIEDLEEFPREVVVWVHETSRKVLGWTYLHRINPAGIRPFFKADFIPSKYRSFGIGVSELLYSTNNHIDAVHNLKLDNGILSSLQFGFYRAASAIKPQTIRLEPGTMYPVEDVNDVKFVNFPFLGSFANQEESVLNQYAERILAISDLQLGQTRGVSGAVRNATGASLISRESNIQLNIHFDRIARALNLMLRSLFNLSRERMPSSLFFRVTGEDGRPIFSKVNRSDLAGDFDFDISVDILSASEQEKQQRAVLMLQTLLNPAALQMGIVTPTNLYNVYREFAKTHGIKRIDDVLSKPQGYAGEMLTPSERIFRITLGMLNPPPASTVQLNEDHERAVRELTAFQESDEFGLLDTQEKLLAFKQLLDAHMQMLQIIQSAGQQNRAGLQVSPDSLGAIQGMQGGMEPMAGMGQQASPLESPMGEARGPVV